MRSAITNSIPELRTKFYPIHNIMVRKNKEDTIEPLPDFLTYSLELFIDGATGLFLGLMVNYFSDWLQCTFGFDDLIKIILQIVLITLTLYIIKITIRKLFRSWRKETDYGIVFVSLFLASQRNIVKFVASISGQNNGEAAF